MKHSDMKARKTWATALACWTLVCGINTHAQTNGTWEAITLNDQGQFFINPKSIELEDGRKKVWSVLDYKKVQTTADGKSYWSIQSQIQLNCPLKMARVLHLTFHSGPMLTGQVVNRQGMLHEWMAIDPSSPIQKIHRRIC